jgi:hypothetical protein
MLEVEKKLRVQLGDDLRAAMKGRESTRAAAVRSLIAALDNASAVPLNHPQALSLEKHGCYEEAALVRSELEVIEAYVAWACSASAGSA